MRRTANNVGVYLAAMILTVSLPSLWTAGDPITDVIDWNIESFSFPNGSTLNTGGTSNTVPPSNPDACLLAGLQDTTSWIEQDFWADPMTSEVTETPAWNISVSPWEMFLSQSSSDALPSRNTEIVENRIGADVRGSRFNDSDFLDELAATDWIGISAQGKGTKADLAGLSEAKLMVPEPREILFLVTALLVALLALRRRRLPVAS